MKIAIIPARSGSKRIKNKNIKNFLGKPIISYTILNLLQSKVFDKIYVSTNSKKIAKISEKYGASVPFLRESKLADDKTSTIDVISNFLKKNNFNKKKIKIVCCVYPCTPLLDVNDLKKGIKIFLRQKKSFVYPILKYKHPVQRSFYITKKGGISYHFPKFEKFRTQDLKSSYHDAGQFYISNFNNWINRSSLHIDATGFEISFKNAIDIDDPDDWTLAEYLYKIKNK